MCSIISCSTTKKIISSHQLLNPTDHGLLAKTDISQTSITVAVQVL